MPAGESNSPAAPPRPPSVETKTVGAPSPLRRIRLTRATRPQRAIAWWVASIATLIIAEVVITTSGLTNFGTALMPLGLEDRFQPMLITMNVTIAVFAANFSFVGYQFSPYRGLLRGVPSPHVLLASATLAISLVPAM